MPDLGAFDAVNCQALVIRAVFGRQPTICTLVPVLFIKPLTDVITEDGSRVSWKFSYTRPTAL